MRNAIPRECFALLVVDTVHQTNFERATTASISDIENEYSYIEPGLCIVLNSCELPETVMELEVQQPLLKSLQAAHNGVYRMSPVIDGLVETSNNVARVKVDNGQCSIGCLTRSSVDSSKKDLVQALKSTFELAGFVVKFSGEYPGWTPNMQASILRVLTDLYKNLFNSAPRVVACHAGLECGILGTHYPEMEMISFGPNIKGAHSPDESLQISSVQKFWVFIKAILAAIPKA